jgi:cyanophycinase
MKKNVITILLISIFLSLSANLPAKKGTLFIIGGGKVNASMRDQMLKASGLDKGGYMVILPMSSEEEPLVNAEEISSVLNTVPSLKIYTYNIQKGDYVSPQRLDSIRNACLIFISGGDQVRFLEVTKGTGINEAIHDAYNKGSLIAGTSAGASLMSKIMVTGNAIKHPDDNFTCIEAGNVETIEGLGFLENVTIDQHFVVRKRYNRMLSYGLENPHHMSIGIDEATAIFVNGKKATVFGISQVIVLRNKGAKIFNRNGLLSANGLKLDIYLAGDTFTIY